jgi:hypothetical protein
MTAPLLSNFPRAGAALHKYPRGLAALRALGWLLLAALVAAAIGSALLALLGPELHVHFGGDPHDVRDLGWAEWPLVVLGFWLAALIVITVVPLSLAFAALMVVLSLAWAGAPLIFAALFAVWWWRRRRARRTAAPTATA